MQKHDVKAIEVIKMHFIIVVLWPRKLHAMTVNA